MPITYIIIGFTVLISLYSFSNQNVLRDMVMNPYLINTRQQYYRFLTSGFIHADHMHLIMNMISLYFFGVAVEQNFHQVFDSKGTLYFILLYTMGIVVSDVPTFFKNKHNPGYNSLGASGGVASVIFAFIIFQPLANLYLYMAIPIPGMIFGVLYLIYSYYSGKRSRDNINHDAHLWGALFGLFFCAVLYPKCIPEFFEQIKHWKLFSGF